MKILLIGPPGSGKGSVSELIIKNNQFTHLSTGNLFRALLKQNNDLAHELNSYISNGNLVPDDLTNKIAKNAINGLIQKNESFILDGYPRTINQAQTLAQYCDLDYIFYLDIDDKELIKRLTGRRICQKCNAIYNVFLKPTKLENHCDLCQEETLIQRSDDKIEAVEVRLNTYQQQTLPLIKHYQSMPQFIKIDASKPIDEVYKIINSYIQK